MIVITNGDESKHSTRWVSAPCSSVQGRCDQPFRDSPTSSPMFANYSFPGAEIGFHRCLYGVLQVVLPRCTTLPRWKPPVNLPMQSRLYLWWLVVALRSPVVLHVFVFALRLAYYSLALAVNKHGVGRKTLAHFTWCKPCCLYSESLNMRGFFRFNIVSRFCIYFTVMFVLITEFIVNIFL